MEGKLKLNILNMGISKKHKELLCEWTQFECEICQILKKAKKLSIGEIEIHKINAKLGYKSFRNLKVLCIKHHEQLSSAHRIASGIQSSF